MSFRQSMSQLRPARTPKQDLQEKVQLFLTEAAMARDDFFKRDNQANFAKKAAAGQIVGKDGKKFPALSKTNKLLVAFKELKGEPKKDSQEKEDFDALMKLITGGKSHTSIEKGLNGFSTPSSGNPKGEDWESLIAVAANKINGLTWSEGDEWDRAEKFWADYETPSMKLGNAFVKELKIKGLLKQLGSSTLDTNKDWKGVNKTPKTDLIYGKQKISLKKSGGSQLMSAGKAESISTFEAAMSMYSIDKSGKTKVNNVMEEIENRMGKLSTATTISRLEDLRDSGKKLSKTDEDAIEEMEGLQLEAEYLNKELDSLFQDQTFKQYFCWEAATGETKFEPSPKGISNKLVVFNETGSISNTLALDSPDKAGKTIASKNSFYVSFKTGGSKSKPYLSLRTKGFKPNLTEQISFRDIVLDELSKSEYGQTLLVESNLQQLDEFQIFNRLVAKVKSVAGTIKNKVKNIYNAIMKRVTQAFNYIKRLGKKLIEGLMNFLGVEVSDVTVNKGRGDFALL